MWAARSPGRMGVKLGRKDRDRGSKRDTETQGASGRRGAAGGPSSLLRGSLDPRTWARVRPRPGRGVRPCSLPWPQRPVSRGCAAAPLGPTWGYLQFSHGGSGGASGRLGSSWLGPRGFSPGGLADSVRAVATISSRWPWSPTPGPMAGAGSCLPRNLCGCGPHPRLTSRKGGAQRWPVV